MEAFYTLQVIFFISDLFILCVLVFVPACMYVHRVSVLGACGGWKRVSDGPELELEVTMSCHVDAEN